MNLRTLYIKTHFFGCQFPNVAPLERERFLKVCAEYMGASAEKRTTLRSQVVDTYAAFKSALPCEGV